MLMKEFETMYKDQAPEDINVKSQGPDSGNESSHEKVHDINFIQTLCANINFVSLPRIPSTIWIVFDHQREMNFKMSLHSI